MKKNFGDMKLLPKLQKRSQFVKANPQAKISQLLAFTESKKRKSLNNNGLYLQKNLRNASRFMPKQKLKSWTCNNKEPYQDIMDIKDI